MAMSREWNDKIFTTKPENFEALALEIFRFQYKFNPVYREYTRLLKVDPGKVRTVGQLPFMPVRFFKTHKIKTTDFDSSTVFESSGTTGDNPSRHFIKEVSIYEESFLKSFELNYGPVQEWCILALLPSYMERGNASLVYMADRLVKDSHHPRSGFYLDEYDKLISVIKELESAKQKTVMLGVSFALLDLAEKFKANLKFTILMETGGMKGRRQEITRDELHDTLKRSFGVKQVHSEYGMTELLSQAYSHGDGIFNVPPWMKILLRDEEDPLKIKLPENNNDTLTGVINIIDLANVYSCSFISTDDIGKLYPDGRFEVLGRMDGSDLRGCSLMLVER
jgi:phenylacetate-coenzyme A ligase PaaK-like adenylate-forming protein